MSDLAGKWKWDGFVVPVPFRLWKTIHVIRVHGATAQIKPENPSRFCVIIPKTLRDAEAWRVTVGGGALTIKPPAVAQRGGSINVATGNARVGMQLGNVGSINIGGASTSPSPRRRVSIGLILPRNILVYDEL